MTIDEWLMASSEGELVPMDRDQLIEFIRELGRSISDDPDSWQNLTLESFFEALSAWLEGVDRRFGSMGKPTPAPSWELFALMLHAGRIYE